jgi:hypothetical protein
LLYQIAKISHEQAEMHHLQPERPSRYVMLGTLINGLIQYIVLIPCIVQISIDNDIIIHRWLGFLAPPHLVNVHFMGAGIYL